VQELEACWDATVGQRRTVPRVDLTGVTHIDAAGKAYLATLHRQGAKFVTADCLTEGIVAEITNE
jgi:ABC-type transporter Mla MlaB component